VNSAYQFIDLASTVPDPFLLAILSGIKRRIMTPVMTHGELLVPGR
jgi:hypothetical protein